MPQLHTPETDDAAQARYCGECGTRLEDARFCPGCGREVSRSVGADAATPQHRPAPAQPPAGTGASRSRRPMVFAAVALVVVLGAIAAFVLLSGSGGDDEQVAYREKVAGTFGPVLGANQKLSDELSRLRGTKRLRARLAVRRAQQATTSAAGALGALSVPEGSEKLATDARQVLDRERAYLSAVSAVLRNPSSSSRGQLETLESNLTTALSEAGPSVAGTEQTVSGAARLTAWAPRAAAAIKDGKGGTPAPPQSGGTPSAPPATNPYSNGRSCGGGLYAGPNTSCEFAENVRDAYYEAPGATATVRVFSPATGLTYTMNCAPSGTGITCSGGNNASVTF